MKLLRRAASSRRKTADVGLVGVGGVGGARWTRAATATSSPPKVVPVYGAPGVTSPLLDYLRSMTAAYKLTLLVVAGNLIVGAVLAVILNSPTSDTLEQFLPPPPENQDPNNTLPGGIRIISKQQWRGQPARSHLIDEDPHVLDHPTPYVIISHTASAPCFDPSECSRRCRDIQDKDMLGHVTLADIAPNFLVGGDGNVYEGRGWDAANNRAGLGGLVRRKNVDISFIGNFTLDEPTNEQLKSALELLDLGVKLGNVVLDYKLFAQNDTEAVMSPGVNIFVHIKDWPHFACPNDASP